jgi:hypothetical protein
MKFGLHGQEDFLLTNFKSCLEECCIIVGSCSICQSNQRRDGGIGEGEVKEGRLKGIFFVLALHKKRLAFAVPTTCNCIIEL